MVIRDLTLRSAASFGSFHLIRLLYDEYMFYLIEHQVAVATGTTPIAVMGDVCIFNKKKIDIICLIIIKLIINVLIIIFFLEKSKLLFN